MKLAVAALVVLLISWTGFAADRAMPPTIHEVKTKHSQRFLALPGVVSVGVGRNAGGGEVIVVGLDRARPETQSKLPEQLEGYTVQVQIIGTVKAR